VNSTETIQFVRYIAALFPATKVDEFTADAWHDVLHKYDLADLRAAALAVSERQAFCALADIVGEIKRLRARRLDGFVYVPGDGDGDPQVYLARRRAQIELVASGRRAADPEKAIGTGSDRVAVGELVAGIGRPVPDGAP
jgi:hypothetical protein